jgi:hypothetical protein
MSDIITLDGGYKYPDAGAGKTPGLEGYDNVIDVVVDAVTL